MPRVMLEQKPKPMTFSEFIDLIDVHPDLREQMLMAQQLLERRHNWPLVLYQSKEHVNGSCST